VIDAAAMNAVRDVVLAIVSAWTIYQEARIKRMCQTCPYYPANARPALGEQ